MWERFCFMRKSVNIIFTALRTLSFEKILQLLQLTLRHPLFTLCGFFATLKAFAVAKEKFPESHSTNGIGNAFRHAYWSALIATYCAKISSPEKALRYAKKMTDLHEKLFPNKPLETAMDLHNNALGLQLFQDMLPKIHRQFFEPGFFIEILDGKMKTAKILRDVDEDVDDELVYLDDDNT